jgi:hypothetical protein
MENVKMTASYFEHTCNSHMPVGNAGILHCYFIFCCKTVLIFNTHVAALQQVGVLAFVLIKLQGKCDSA